MLIANSSKLCGILVGKLCELRVPHDRELGSTCIEFLEEFMVFAEIDARGT